MLHRCLLGPQRAHFYNAAARRLNVSYNVAMKQHVLPIVFALALAGCGGGGSVSPAAQTTNPQNQMTTYTGQYFNAQNQALGTVSIQVQGTSLKATCASSSPTGSTWLIVGNISGSKVVTPDANATQLATYSLNGSTLSLGNITDWGDKLYPLSITATAG